MATAARLDTLAEIREKVLANERLDFDDGVTLLETDDLTGLGELADTARRLRGGTDDVFFVNNLYLNFTNVCRVKCKFCAFAVTGKQPSAYTWEIDKLVEHAVDVHQREQYSEIHMVGGENPHLEYSYYIDLTRELHNALPDVHLKLYTASEIHHMHKLSGLPHAQILAELQEVGLGSLPGGGAEVFADRVRRLVAPGKEHPDNWIATHRAAHGIGMPTHCTMLYGHVENYEERVDHWMRLRDLQDETGGFLAFVPLPFHPENTVFQRRGWRFSTGYDDLKMVAASRLMLDNIPNIKAYWIMLSTPVAQVALHYGANDIQGTVMEEQIAHAAGAVTAQEEKVQSLVTLIRDAGRMPVQRDTLYNVVRTLLRLGRISYANMAPVFYELDGEGLEQVSGVPTTLNRMLMAGEIDVAPISSIEYARNADKLRLLPRLCVSTEGAVDSIQLITRKPIEQVRSVAVTPESSTSVVLTRVLLGEVELVPLDQPADARMLIGDAALQSAFDDPTPHYDLGRLWQERTGLPMVYAVWACRQGVEEGLEELERAHLRALAVSRSEPEALARRASAEYGWPAGFLARYFEKLRYHFGPRERQGLVRFFELAHLAGELDTVPDLHFVQGVRTEA